MNTWRPLVLAALLLADFAIHPHALFGLDGTFGFYAWYGLVTCMAMVLVAKGLGVFLKRPDDYYADGGEGPNDEEGDEEGGEEDGGEGGHD